MQAAKTLDGRLPLSDLYVSGDTELKKTTVTDTTASGSSTTGALIVTGGVGIGGNLNVGGSITGGSISYASTTTGTLSVTNTTNATSTTTGVLTVAGGAGVAKDFYASGVRATSSMMVGSTAAPATTFQTVGSGTFGALSGDYIGNNLYFSGTWQRTTASSAGGAMRVGGSGDAFGYGLQFVVADSSNAANVKLLVQADGKVGVNTATPSTTLDVRSATNSYGVQHSDGTIQLSTYVGGTSITAGWLGTVSNHPLCFYVNNGTPSMTIATSGNVGLSILSPTEKLDVNGNGQFQSTIKLKNGSNTNTLTTDASGNLSTTSIATTQVNVTGNSYASPAFQVINNASVTGSHCINSSLASGQAVGSEVMLAVGKALSTNNCAQLSFVRGSTAADHEIRLHQYGDINSGIIIKNGQLKIGSGSYLPGYTDTTYTPTTRNEDNSGVITYTTQSGTYVKMGRQCTAYCNVVAQWAFPQSGKKIYIKLPFTSAFDFAQVVPTYSYDGTTYYAALVYGYAGSDEVILRYYDPTTNITPIESLFLTSTTSITQDLTFTLQCTYITS